MSHYRNLGWRLQAKSLTERDFCAESRIGIGKRRLQLESSVDRRTRYTGRHADS